MDFCLDDICRMDFIQHFVNLKELILNNQGIQVMEGIDRLKNLEKCWLTHNYFDSIKCFDKLRNVRELYLGYNRITKTSGLEKCIMLEKLWIDCNHIDTIVGLGSLERLEHINFAGNHIETIGIGFDGLVSLSVLNLAANKIGNFKEVLNLNRLPCLSISTFNDPHYGDNPICNLCNYNALIDSFYVNCTIQPYIIIYKINFKLNTQFENVLYYNYMFNFDSIYDLLIYNVQPINSQEYCIKIEQYIEQRK